MLKTGGEQTTKQSATGAPGATDAAGAAGTKVVLRFGVTLGEVNLQERATKNVVSIPRILERSGVGTQEGQGT